MLELHILIEKEGDLYSALCLELNIASQGYSIHQAEKNIKEAIELYLEDVYEAGDEKEFIPRPAPVKEWLKYFKKQTENLESKIKTKHLRPRLKEVIIG